MSMAGPPSRQESHQENERWNNLLGNDDDDDNSISQRPTSSPTVNRSNPRISDNPSSDRIPSLSMPEMPLTTGLPGKPTLVSPNWSALRSEQPGTLSTLTSSSTTSIGAHSELGGVSTLVATTTPTKKNPGSSTATNDSFDDGNFLDPNDKDEPKNVALYAAGIVPVVMLVIIGVFIFFCLRKRKRQREINATQAKIQEMKSRNLPVAAAHYGAPPPSPPASSNPQYSPPPPTMQAFYTAPSSHPPPPSSPTIPQPVILGPIAPASNGAYFTGIDTSDVVSMNDRTGLGDPFADSNSLTEEPPPPYRPRSLAPLSRGSSLRTPVMTHSRTNLIAEERSPFADPPDDDSVLVISGNGMHGQRDAMSVVSDLSYQDEPAVTRRAI